MCHDQSANLLLKPVPLLMKFNLNCLAETLLSALAGHRPTILQLTGTREEQESYHPL
jgi:hypothetical protein